MWLIYMLVSARRTVICKVCGIDAAQEEPAYVSLFSSMVLSQGSADADKFMTPGDFDKIWLTVSAGTHH